jgi:signal transduction histidine kinase
VAQEALTNIVKHAAATRVRLKLRATAVALELRVSDDGRGFEEFAAERSGGYGITGMRERSEIGGGSLRVEGRDSGTTVALTLPLQ